MSDSNDSFIKKLGKAVAYLFFPILYLFKKINEYGKAVEEIDYDEEAQDN